MPPALPAISKQRCGGCGKSGRAWGTRRRTGGSAFLAPRRRGLTEETSERQIEIVSATRCDAEEFKQTPLAQSLGRLGHDRRLTFHVTLSNSAGLPEIYNRRIQESATTLVFVHDDVWIDDYFLADRVIDGLGLYHVIGVAGNTRLIDSHVAWHLREGKWDFPHLSGAVAHGAAPFGRVTRYGEVLEMRALDGVSSRSPTVYASGERLVLRRAIFFPFL